MLTINQTFDSSQLTFLVESCGEFWNTLILACDLVIELISEREFRTRLGFTSEEVMIFKQRVQTMLENTQNLKTVKVTFTMTVTADELAISNQLLNEVRNGIHIPDFDNTFQPSRETMRQWLTMIHIKVQKKNKRRGGELNDSRRLYLNALM